MGGGRDMLIRWKGTVAINTIVIEPSAPLSYALGS